MFRIPTDPDPRIHTTGLRIQILPFQWFSWCQEKVRRRFIYCTSGFTENKSLRGHKTSEIEVFRNFLLVIGKIRIRTNKYGSARPKNLRIRILYSYSAANLLVSVSVADPGCTCISRILIFIQPGSNNSSKRGETFFWDPTIFCCYKNHKIVK